MPEAQSNQLANQVNFLPNFNAVARFDDVGAQQFVNFANTVFQDLGYRQTVDFDPGTHTFSLTPIMDPQGGNQNGGGENQGGGGENQGGGGAVQIDPLFTKFALLRAVSDAILHFAPGLQNQVTLAQIKTYVVDKLAAEGIVIDDIPLEEALKATIQFLDDFDCAPFQGGDIRGLVS